MSIIKCPECGREISSFAKFCPHCGFPMKEEEKSEENKTKKEETKNLVSLYKFTIQKSTGTPVGVFIFMEIMIVLIIVICAFAGMIAIIISVVFCFFLEIIGVIGMVNDIVLYNKLNRLTGNQLLYNPTNKILLFEDVNHVKHEILIANIVKLDGPSTLSITFKESLGEIETKVMVGNTCREDVLKLREKIQELTDHTGGFPRQIPPML